MSIFYFIQQTEGHFSGILCTNLMTNIGIMCTKGSVGQVSADTIDRYIDRYVGRYSVDTRPSIGRVSVEYRPTLSADTWPTLPLVHMIQIL